LKVTDLHELKREGRKIVGVVCWDPATAKLADDLGVELVSVGDSAAESFEELLVFCAAVRRGVTRALLSCDLPQPSVERAQRLLDVGADLVKVESDAGLLAAAGISVFAQLDGSSGAADALVAEARRLEGAGAALLDFRHSGPDAGARVAAAVAIPVLGGLGGGPWLDGRVRAVNRLLDEALAAYVDDVRGARAVKGD
jgi:3-methyl-2-oxobutanoate hydroxymethyltransferase